MSPLWLPADSLTFMMTERWLKLDSLQHSEHLRVKALSSSPLHVFSLTEDGWVRDAWVRGGWVRDAVLFSFALFIRCFNYGVNVNVGVLLLAECVSDMWKWAHVIYWVPWTWKDWAFIFKWDWVLVFLCEKQHRCWFMTPQWAPWLSVDFSRVLWKAGEASVALTFPRSQWSSDWRRMFVLNRFVCLAHSSIWWIIIIHKYEPERRVFHYYPCRWKTSQLELIDKASAMIDSPRMKDIRTLVSFMVLGVYWSEHRCSVSPSPPVVTSQWPQQHLFWICDSLLFISRVV